MSFRSSFFAAAILCCLPGLFSVLNAQENQYARTASGLKYRLIKSTPNAARPASGDVVELTMMYLDSRDSILFDNRKGDFQFTHYVEKPAYPGDFNEALMLLGKGDSASFILKADSFYTKTLRQPHLPSFLKKGSDLRFFVRMVNLIPGQEYMKLQWEAIQETNARNETLKQQEKDSLRDYLQRNVISVQPTPSGLYYLPEREGNGPNPVKGNKVLLDYTASLLNGKIIESSKSSGKPLELTIGIRTTIRGLEEGVMMMKKGGKATLIIPSAIGYGENQAGDVPPFSILKYEVELIEIK